MELTKSEGGSIFRKIAMGSWRNAGDPSVYGQLELDMTEVLAFLKRINFESQHKIGINEFIGLTTARVLKERPEMNGMIKLGRIYLRKHVNLYYQVNVPGQGGDQVGKATLLGVTIPQAESKSLQEIANEFKSKVQELRTGRDRQMVKNIRTISLFPWALVGWALNFTSFLNYDLNLPLHYFGLPKDSFGSVMITNVGSLGVDTAWAPLVGYTKVPLMLTVGAIKDRAWVVGGEIKIRPVMRIGFTFDHRFMDGVHAAAMSRLFHQYFENPELLNHRGKT